MPNLRRSEARAAVGPQARTEGCCTLGFTPVPEGGCQVQALGWALSAKMSLQELRQPPLQPRPARVPRAVPVVTKHLWLLSAEVLCTWP